MTGRRLATLPVAFTAGTIVGAAVTVTVAAAAVLWAHRDPPHRTSLPDPSDQFWRTGP